MLTLDLVIIHYNENKYIPKLFESIKAQSFKPKKIFFVDNFSEKDPTTELKKQKGLDIECIRTQKNLFFAAGTNIGLRKALNDNPDVIGILNADTRFEKNCFKTLMSFLENNSTTIGVSPKILNYAGNKVIFKPIKYSRFLRKFSTTEATESTQTDALGGAHAFIRTNVLKNTGIFYEPFYHGTEDLYLNYKLRKLGKMFYLPEAVGYHRDWNEDRPARNPKSQGYLQISARNSYVYSIKTKDPFLFLMNSLSFAKNILFCLLFSINSPNERNLYKDKVKGFLWGVSETFYHLSNNSKYLDTHIDYDKIRV